MSFWFQQQCEDVLVPGEMQSMCRVCASTSSDLVCWDWVNTILRIEHPTNTGSSDERLWPTICVSTGLSLEALLTPVPAFTARALWRTCSSSERTMLQRASHRIAVQPVSPKFMLSLPPSIFAEALKSMWHVATLYPVAMPAQQDKVRRRIDLLKG